MSRREDDPVADEEATPGHGAEPGGDVWRTLADKLNRLFEIMHPAGERPPSNAKVAAVITEDYGVDISQNYIWMLRNGQRTNPGLRHLQALAWFFGVDPNYFFDSDKARQIDDELALIAALRDTGVRNVALRTAGASAPTRGAIERFTEQATELDERHPWSESPPHDE